MKWVNKAKETSETETTYMKGEVRILHKENGDRAVSFDFFFNDTATTEIYTLSLHDALPIYPLPRPADPDVLLQNQDPTPVKSGARKTSPPPHEIGRAHV